MNKPKTKILFNLSLLTGLLMGLLVANSLQAQICNPNMLLTSPTSQFTLNGNGTATDTKTGLIWKRCSQGQIWDGATCINLAIGYDWQVALTQANDENFASANDWRLPNLKELTSITEQACYDPSINEVVFPAPSTSEFWTSSPYAQFRLQSWVVNFGSGNDRTRDRGTDRKIRLVRGGL